LEFFLEFFLESCFCFLLSGKPILAALKDEQMVLMATGVYFLIFFSPKDLVFQLVKLVPVYVTICTLKEILRATKVYKGLAEGKEAMPNNGSIFFIPILIATLKGIIIYSRMLANKPYWPTGNLRI
jgi:hypothetical protein